MPNEAMLMLIRPEQCSDLLDLMPCSDLLDLICNRSEPAEWTWVTLPEHVDKHRPTEGTTARQRRMPTHQDLQDEHCMFWIELYG